MRSFIPNFEEPPESDDSGDEVPVGGVFQMVALDIDADDPTEDDDTDHQDNNMAGVHTDGDDSHNPRDDDANDNEIDSSSCSDSSDTSDSSETEATIEDIFGVKPSLEAQRNHPPDLETDSGIVDVCFHPNIELLSVATMDGEVMIYRYSRDSVEEVTRFSHHKKPCRTVCYNGDGTLLYTVSKDKSLAVIDTQNSAVKEHIKDAHESPIFSFLPIDENLCATGDDDGTVKIWDLRKKNSIFDFRCGEQAVSSLITDESKKILVAAVNDGSIAGFNIRGKQLETQSEFYGSEMTSLALVRNDTRLVVGSGEGTLFIFKWGEFGFHIDRFAGHPDYIHCIIPITDRMMLTGCEDGNIRAVHLYAHRFVGVVGQHNDFGVENMSVSSDGSILASCSMDEVVRFWNIEYLYNTEVDDRKKGKKKQNRGFNLESSKRRNKFEFFSDFPDVMESDDEGGPVAGPSHTME
ncbi:WD repeat-containing protein 55-like isoform X2 [Homarus americanus]|uniref:WD repeat-containing protein 55 homolog n=1 Tax=Homarus americanus TaxID=6706 RepID=A0A8J5N447_HOMAM|nr:WD repeat-containing protein 55-like isoform X2 [Homarus americanus]KAG7173068.1 WD repeat-containing protein 55-like [Homarus americanus]